MIPPDGSGFLSCASWRARASLRTATILAVGLIGAFLVSGCKQQRLLPEGTWVARQAILKNTPNGKQYLPEGALVHFVSEEGGQMTVEYQGMLFTSARADFSNSEEVRDAIHAKRKVHTETFAAKSRRTEQLRAHSEREARKSSHEYHGNLAQSRLAEASASLAALDRRIAAALKERQAKRGHDSFRYSSDGYYSGGSYRRRNHVQATLSQDAAQLDQLQEARRAMVEKVRAMEAKANTGP